MLLQVKHVSLGLGGGRDNKRTVREAIRKFSEDPEVRIANLGEKSSVKSSVSFCSILQLKLAVAYRVCNAWSALW
jgi:hypothetical protein